MFKKTTLTVAAALLLSAASGLAAKNFTGGTLRLSRVKQSSYSGSGTLTAPAVYKAGGVSFHLKQGEKVSFNPKHNFVTKAVLARPMRISVGGYTYRLQAGKEVSFSRTYRGQIYFQGGHLAMPMTVKVGSGNALIKGRIALYSDGKLLAADLARHTRLRRGSHEYLFAANSRIMLSSSGQLESGNLRSPQNIRIGNNTLPVRGNSWGSSSISFSYNGSILSVTLDRDAPLRVGRTVYTAKKNSLVTFYKNGAVKQLRVAGPVRTRAGVAQAGYKIQFLANGTVQKVSRY